MAQQLGSWGAFVRLWVVLFFSYAILKLLFDLIAGGYLDLRGMSLVELVALPLGQAVVCWVVTRRGRMASDAAGAID